MSEFWLNFHFLRPWFLCFLLAPVLLFFIKQKAGEQISSWGNVCDKNLLDFLLVKGSNAKNISLSGFIYLGMIAASIAAAGPCWKKTELPTFVIENPTMFVLSMAQDMMLTDISPSRLERAKFAITDLANNIPDGQFGLEVYSEEPYIITPISDDSELLKNLMPQIVSDIVPDHGDRLDRAMDMAVSRFEAAGYSQGNIILLASDVGQRFDLALENAKKAAQLGYKIYVIDTSYSGNEKLKLLAQNGNGLYLSVKSPDYQDIVRHISKNTEERTKLSQNLRAKFIDYGYYLLVIPLFCTLVFFRRGLLIWLMCCLLPTYASAGFLRNNNQEGLHLFNQGAYDEALQYFDNKDWRGAALYKQDKLEEALAEFKKSQTSLANYNQGVILTKLCKYKEAKEAFTKALQVNSLNKDAEYNLRVLNDLFERAKEDPSLLNCNDDNQQQNQDSQDNQKDEQNQNNNKSASSDKEKQDNSSEQKQNNDSQADNDSQREQQKDNKPQQQDNNEQQQNDSSSKENQTQQNEQKNNESSSDEQQNNQQAKNQNNNQNPKSQPDGQNQQQSSENSKSNENEQKNNEENSAPSSLTEKEQAVNLIQAKKGSEDEKYDDEALIMQQRYRKIPETPGGLLREFIKKEYVKDRYGDANI